MLRTYAFRDYNSRNFNIGLPNLVVFRPCHSIVNFERRTTYFVKVFIALPTTLTFLCVFHFEMIRILGALAQKHNVSIVLKQFGAATENYTHILYLLRGSFFLHFVSVKRA